MKKRLQHFIGALVVLGSLMAGYIYFKDNFDVLKDTIKIWPIPSIKPSKTKSFKSA